MSRDPHKPDEESRRFVGLHTALGTPQEDIARAMGIAPKTLRKHYREELDTGATIANGLVGGALFNKAVNGDTAAQIWWTKSRMGWREKQDATLKVAQEFTGFLVERAESDTP